MGKELGDKIRAKFEKHRGSPGKKVMVSVEELGEWARLADSSQGSQGHSVLATVAIEEWRVKAEQFQRAFENERKVLADARSIIEMSNAEIARLNEEMDVDTLRAVVSAKRIVSSALANYKNPRVTNVTLPELIGLLENMDELLSCVK